LKVNKLDARSSSAWRPVRRSHVCLHEINGSCIDYLPKRWGRRSRADLTQLMKRVRKWWMDITRKRREAFGQALPESVIRGDPAVLRFVPRTTDGAPAKYQLASTRSQIAQPADDSGANGTIVLPNRWCTTSQLVWRTHATP